VTIAYYDDATGRTILDEALEYYHYGAADEGDTGIDMRAEVLLLTRNIKITGTDTDNWGCAIVTSDTEEFAVDESVIERTGVMYLHNVEVEFCG